VRRRAWRGRLALLAAGIAVALPAGEGLVRVLRPQPLRPAWDDEADGIRVPRAGLTGRHRHPGAFDVTVTVNAQRFRGTRDYAAAPAPGTLRVAVLGDSITFGWGASEADTYPAQLERLLARGGPVEVINAGFPGTCLGEKLAWYESGVRRLRPRLVLLTLVGDDVNGDLHWRVYGLRDGEAVRAERPARTALPARRTRGLLARVPGTAWLAEHSQLFALVRRALTRALSRERTTDLGQQPATPAQEREFREEGLTLMRAELRRLARLAAQDGAAAAVVFVPFRQSVYPDQGWWADELRWKSTAMAEAARDELARHGVPFLDVTPALTRRARAGAPLYHAGDETHPTPAGYRAIAEEVAAWLQQSGAVSAGARPDDAAAEPAHAGPGAASAPVR
jgi:lysophospholipase L1-like esterase